MCWGANFLGQLGDGTTSQHLTPVDVSGLTSGIVAITAGEYQTCALTSLGGVKCWGSNELGQLGDGTTTDRLTPVDVSGLTSGVVGITAGGYHTCALMTSGGVKCWGYNAEGQLGDGTTTVRLTPVDVTGLTSGVAAIAAGDAHTCAVTTLGGAKCWGSNGGGQLGDGTHVDRHAPVDVLGLASGVDGIAAGGFFSCALTTAGGVKCWGYNGFAQLGDGTRHTRLTPTDVSGLTSGVAAISAGGSNTCALTSLGGVKCWGAKSGGALGNGTKTSQITPVDVRGLKKGVAAISVGEAEFVGSHSCALTTSGAVRCWGLNDGGGVGDGTRSNRYLPVTTWGFTGAIGKAYRPDGQISTHRLGPYAGNDIYNLTGSKQTARSKIVSGETLQLYVRLQNDGESSDSFFLAARMGTPAYLVRYSRGAKTITKRVRRGIYWVTVPAGSSKQIKIIVTATTRAALGSSITILVRAESAGNCKMRDVVRAIVSV